MGDQVAEVFYGIKIGDYNAKWPSVTKNNNFYIDGHSKEKHPEIKEAFPDVEILIPYETYEIFFIIEPTQQMCFNGNQPLNTDLIRDTKKEDRWDEQLISICKHFNIKPLSAPSWFLSGHYN